MTTDPLAEKISTITELKKVISRRASHIVIASNFQAWPDAARKFYRFLPPDSKGIHACERVWHPGSSRLAGFEDLCNLILGGCEVVIELAPECQQAILFSEILLATLNEDIEARECSSQPVYKFVKATDWSARDGTGPKTLLTPTVIGFTDSENLKAYGVKTPAIIWSKHWLLSGDPIDTMLKHIGQIVEQNNALPEAGEATGALPHEIDLWADQIFVGLQIWIENQRNMPTLDLDNLAKISADGQLRIPPHKKMLDGAQVDCLCEKLARRIREPSISALWRTMIRAPDLLMFEKSGSSFEPNTAVMKDCWGYPFAFDMAFGSGIVKVRCEGVKAIDEPAAEISAKSTPTKYPPAVIETPDDLLCIDEAAKYANVSARTITTWLNKTTADGRPMLPGVIRTHRRVKIPRRDLDPWRSAKASTASPPAEPRKNRGKKKKTE